MSPLTVSGYGRDLAELTRFVRETRPEVDEPGGIDLALLRSFLGRLAKGQKPATLARKMAAVRSWFRFLVKRRQLEKSPAASLALPKVRRKLPVVLNVDAAAQVMAAPEGDAPDMLRDRAILEVFYSSGLRLSELVGLDLEALSLAPASEPATARPKEWQYRRLLALRAGALFGERARSRWRNVPSIRRRCFCPDGGGASRYAQRRSSALGAGRGMWSLTPCATPVRPTCWRAVPTCERSRTVSVMSCRRHSATPHGSHPHGTTA
jgi:integrase